MDDVSISVSTMALEPEDALEPSGPDIGMTINAVLKIIFYTVLMILGICGNILILGVYWSKPHKTSTHVLIMSLAWIDLIACLLRVYNLAIFIPVLAGRGDTSGFLDYAGVANVISVAASVVVTGVIAVERFDCVCRPHDRLLNQRRTKLMVLGSFAAAIIVAIPYTKNRFSPSPVAAKTAMAFQLALYLSAVLMIVICYGKVYSTIRKHVKVNVVGRQEARNEWPTAVDGARRRGRLTSVRSTNASITSPTSTHGKPSTTGIWIISTADLDIGATSAQFAVRREVSATAPNPAAVTDCENSTPAPQGDDKPNGRPPRRPRIASPRSRENPVGPAMTLQRKTTRMLFVTSVVFLVTWFPYWLYVAVALYKYNGGEVHDNVLQVLNYCTLPMYVNSVVNPFIYGFSNRRFRKDCLDVLRKIRPR